MSSRGERADQQSIFIIAGEASGDMHAAALCRELLSRDRSISITGVGGPAMKEAGVELLFPNSRLAVVGILEVLSHAGPIIDAYRSVTRWLRQHRPSLLILVDYPEFNLLVASRAKRLGIPVFYYISPQVWAWREGRVKRIRRLVDGMAVILPFEKEFYAKHGMDVVYTGHPLLDEVRPSMDRDAFCLAHSMQPEQPVVGLLPGSRSGEIKRFFPILLQAGKLILNRIPASQFVIPAASGLDNDIINYMRDEIHALLPAWDRDNFRILQHKTHDAIAASDIILTASGTVTLEAGIIGTPMVVMYTVSPLTYFLGRRLIKVEFCSLVNLVAGREIVPEILQDDVTPQRLADEVAGRLENPEELSKMREELKTLRELLGGGGAAGRAADAALELVAA